MSYTGYYGNWPRNHVSSSFQGRPPQSSGSWTQASSDGTNLPPLNSGYVHSGYQAALQSSSIQSAQGVQPKMQPQPSLFMQSAMTYAPSSPTRPPRLGPGGPVRCPYPGCEYSGYEKGVEIHKMDRHLMFPPGYKPPKGAPDGDVGPNVTIPGTGISLNTPDAIEAWIAERKKNWPTAARIAEKQKRKAEAIGRGELGHGPNKRARTEGSQSFGDTSHSYSRGRARGKGRGRDDLRGRGRGGEWEASVSKPKTHPPVTRPTTEPPEKPSVAGVLIGTDENGSNSDSGSNIDPTKDAISSKVEPPDYDETDSDEENRVPATSKDTSIKPHKKRPAKQPAPRAYNHLVDRPSFLRKLLQPEIRHTISNLSQAVRFIVENDMFKGIELKPGDADNVLIKEVQPSRPAD